MENDFTSSPAEQRAVLVARLKRAASLPRMKDGRRPPMHVEGMSDGERIQPDGNLDLQLEPARPSVDEGSVEPGSEQDVHPVEKPETPEPGPAARKRRSRSRSRSRGSKDLRGKFKPPQSPVPPVTPSNDSSPEDSPSPQPLPASSDAIISPIPSHITGIMNPRLLMSPALLSPEYPGTSPPTPMLPTLEALQKGLFRSNSATARMMAMHKLTGGTETYDPFDSSPAATPPLPGKLNRNNTVAGGERHAVRQALFQRLNGRINMDEVTSGGEEKEPINTPMRKRIRRRSRRSSSNAAPRSTTDDSESVSTSTNTPVMPPTPLPLPDDVPPPPVLDNPLRLPTRLTPSINLNDTLAGSRQATPIRLNSQELPPPRKRRSIIIEDQDDEDRAPIHAGYPPPPPPRRFTPDQSPRPPQPSNTPSLDSTQSGLDDNDVLGAPAHMSSRTASRAPSRQQDPFLSSPFSTPLKEKQSRDEDEVLYSGDERSYSRAAYNDGIEREISWIADPVPESRMPINDDYDYEDEESQENPDEDEDEDDIPAPESPKDESLPQVEETSRPSSTSRPIVVETELPLDTNLTHASPSSSSVVAFSNGAAVVRRSDASDSPLVYPQRLSVASRIQSDRSPLSPDFDFEDTRAETPSKQGSSSTWEKLKNTLTRSGSTNGRRSRTNSIVTREQRTHTDSSVSRESGASITVPKNDGPASLAQQQNPLMQSPSASTSALSLSPQTPPRSGVSPIPPASAVDLAKYQHAKLFPFPGMKKLEEQRNRARGMSLSSSTPDIVLSLGNEADLNTIPSSLSNTPSHSPELTRDRKLSHQASDTRLLAKFKNLNSPPISAVPSSSSHPDYFSQGLSSAPATSSTPGRTLPTNVEGVRKWLSAKKLFSQPSTPSVHPPEEARPPQANKKPSLSDLLRGRKEHDLSSDWEEVPSDKATFTHTKSASTPFPKQVTENAELSSVSTQSGSYREDSQRTPKASKVSRPNGMDRKLSGSPAMTPSPIDQSPTPDPWSSISDYPPHTTSESSSTSSSQLSQTQLQGSIVLGRLDDLLARGSKSPMWASVVEDASTRKLLVSSPVLQVVNSNTVKDRFLFLFTDLLIIAKPVTRGPDAFLELTKPNPSDRKFIVKNVVQRSHLLVSGEREDVQSKVASRQSTQSPALSAFVRLFSSDPDRAVGNILSQAGYRDDPIAVGDLLFRTTELDRVQLGEYLSRRSSKAVLKRYIDSFGFSGLRVDKALRTFLMSIGIPSQAPSSSYTPFEILLESFASRWYEANAKNVAYDRDLASKLVRALIQLNEVLHGGISSEPGHPTYLHRNVTDRDFLEAFQRIDPRGLISDELVGDMYDSIRQERLSQAMLRPNRSLPDSSVTFKRLLPPRLTYRIQSEPIVLRIPQPDPHFAIELYGQDLIFDPPVLSFTKSAEASFRITGSSFGPKTIGMLRCGPNAVLYGGLPLSSPVEVERAFMRNTFQMAFLDHNEVKRKYMFSVPDPIMRNEWVVSLKRANSPTYSSPSKFQAASVQLAFRVLQETLLPREALAYSLASSKARDGKAGRAQNSKKTQDERKMDLAAHLVRSKSRSRVYHKHGPGKAELQGMGNGDSTGAYASDQGLEEDKDPDASGDLEERHWSGKDLEMICQQNSSIPLVLAYMQVGTSDGANGGP
ncbi:hypothetical protein CONPUDRAFT_136292 [Coniophora puteana RWD-64-598 SS2]|uniref:SEC7 domain-containing protein n=1 Tax=Coniophora puteana (strain RWD-64-598) TaxID=741705 RepID=A0A5M3MVH7_CONPW|nr:uncharacterized protein CONPUDRAFT_136292 [Coniophora puteana RWD-64-598 SS2]EIW83159.1 hypothetical protein CONPUDRAFT_136292 [Coniophora puteana RWD-64-598 SS2]